MNHRTRLLVLLERGDCASSAAARNPAVSSNCIGLRETGQRTLKGGSFINTMDVDLRVRSRTGDDPWSPQQRATIGFRCAQTVER